MGRGGGGTEWKGTIQLAMKIEERACGRVSKNDVIMLLTLRIDF